MRARASVLRGMPPFVRALEPVRIDARGVLVEPTMIKDPGLVAVRHHYVRPTGARMKQVRRCSRTPCYLDRVSQARASVYVSYEDYLAAEERSEDKHEWLDGVIYAMSRGTPERARLSLNVGAALRVALKGICSVYSSDVMLFVRETNLSTYADASVICGSVETHRVVKNGRALGEAITNPIVIVEVLSDKTADYDRGEKFGHYMRIPSLKDYVLVAQDTVRVEVFRRPDGAGHWKHEIATSDQSITLHGYSIAVDDIYSK